MDAPADILTTYGPWPLLAFMIWWLRSLIGENRTDNKEAIQHIADSTAATREAAAAIVALTAVVERSLENGGVSR